MASSFPEVELLCRSLPLILEDNSNGLSGMRRELISEVAERLKFLEQQLRQYDLRIQRMARQDESCRRLAEIAGVGPLTATALVAAVGNAKEFKSGRELAAYFGLVPGHRASGGHTVMLGISKPGDRYLRTLLVHGARCSV
jgi:transposase